MRKILLLAILVFFTSCTAEPIEVQKELRSPNVPTQLIAPQNELASSVAVCGLVVGVQTFGQVSPPLFIGVRYDIVLDTPYFDGTTTYTKAWFLLNDAQNTYTIQQYWTNPQSVYCGNIPLTNLYN